MINFEFLEKNRESLRASFLTQTPFSFLVIDNFCDPDLLSEMILQIPELQNKSRDYVFANNKFEKSNYKELGPSFNKLHSELKSTRFNDFLSYISCREIFVDPKNHGGGLHQGKQNSFLDMHLDFNYHPINKDWYRDFNLLLYLNKDWKEEYGGHLKIEDLRSGETKELAVPFNRMIIQTCSPYTLHGYDMTSFPEKKYRMSIATYAYSIHKHQIESPRTTDWFPNKGSQSSSAKTFIAKNYNAAVQFKNKLFGIGTSSNR